MKSYTIGLLFLIVLAGNNYAQKAYYQTFDLPGTIQIDSNLYCDYQELSNFGYVEYLAWLKRIFGDSSKVYHQAFPDTTVWKNETNKYHLLSKVYLKHPNHRPYPVVGISLKQAKQYAKWRSDRVFEFFLIHKGEIEWNKNVDSTNYFTIEKYFNGLYTNEQPSPKYKYYPDYRLPTVVEQKMMLLHNKNALKNAKDGGKRIQSCADEILAKEAVKGDTIKNRTPTTNTYSKACFNRNKNPRFSFLFNLDGNVAEFSSQPGKGLTNSWKYHHNTSIGQFSDNQPNAFTGVRFVAEWKVWE